MGLSLEYNAWLRSGNVSYANYVYLLGSSGGYDVGYAISRYAVRPALHLFAEKFIADNSRIRLVQVRPNRLCYEMKGAVAPLAP